ncbi:crossover junction endodeoxyribonuclease RuvC [Halothermothrix orenii]|uniref:Crossover junction endodeoxyribonuclease RuvC n=1 Tax=Halothermothrix orenii (strain H 168 / OCM 544 / DSM 9562) TaxID=373903 RepID=RUVC_HALOH|nr:crossover junction endodeoxyribonuclease RuvC [Halothermothrix orenii]B8CXG4.1 RecName: Full=Crossover junction endodeoxyribonuclease RuvC; AltName: Full=Holliday junction nuclease RuvC; AltName: Full=Holliday junction resolvase RuvC [Halothermothrix orenii H 168]ACL69983.1 crossover junction endodeoxyribonuclease RuvC [Halothermothrix orenii H 168]
MVILGVDPGLAIVGYALIEKQGNKYRVIDYGSINTPSKLESVDRLKIIHTDMVNIINKYNPDQMAVEKLFFNKNVKTAIEVGQARGVILLAGSQARLKIYEYTPLQVKQAVAGYGRAHKSQVQRMVKALLNLNEIPKPDDVADALAISICHGNSYRLNRKWGTKG